ncbi:hypothetical protein Tco_1034335 [Tanacetum coccineum]
MSNFFSLIPFTSHGLSLTTKSGQEQAKSSTFEIVFIRGQLFHIGQMVPLATRLASLHSVFLEAMQDERRATYVDGLGGDLGETLSSPIFINGFCFGINPTRR